MKEAITKSQERYIEARLVEIIVDPEQYGIQEARTYRTEVIDVIRDLVNNVSMNKLSYEQVSEVYDRFMSGDVSGKIRDYFRTESAWLCEVMLKIRYRMQDYQSMFVRYMMKTRSGDVRINMDLKSELEKEIWGREAISAEEKQVVALLSSTFVDKSLLRISSLMQDVDELMEGTVIDLENIHAEIMICV